MHFRVSNVFMQHKRPFLSCVASSKRLRALRTPLTGCLVAVPRVQVRERHTVIREIDAFGTTCHMRRQEACQSQRKALHPTWIHAGVINDPPCHLALALLAAVLAIVFFLASIRDMM